MATKDRNLRRVDKLIAERDEHKARAKAALKTLVTINVHPTALDGLLDEVVTHLMLAAESSIAAGLVKGE
jgi:hypothetical protein